jgi:hypothetical protein
MFAHDAVSSIKKFDMGDVLWNAVEQFALIKSDENSDTLNENTHVFTEQIGLRVTL